MSGFRPSALDRITREIDAPESDYERLHCGTCGSDWQRVVQFVRPPEMRTAYWTVFCECGKAFKGRTRDEAEARLTASPVDDQ